MNPQLQMPKLELPNAADQYRADIIERIASALRYAVTKHCKVLMVRLDLRFPANGPQVNWTSCVSELMRRLRMHYAYHQVDCRYIWAREQSTSNAPHFHLLLLLNGSRIENGWGVRMVAAKIWSRLLNIDCDPCVHLCQTYDKRNGIMIRRPTANSTGAQFAVEQANFHAAINAAFSWATYLAKHYTKGTAPYRGREFGSSQF